MLRKSGLFYIGALLLAAILAGQVMAATTGKISGVVRDKETGEPLVGANIIVEGTILGAATNLKGEYFIINLPPGLYTIKASMMGYVTVSQENVMVRVNRTSPTNFELGAAVLEGQEVVITAERELVEEDVTGTEVIKSAEALQMTPIVEFQDVLKQQRGFFSTGSQIFLRGGIGREINYRVDGISMSTGTVGDNWTSTNASAVQEVSLLTGGYNAEYGDAMSGVVNIVTKEGSRNQKALHGNLNVEYRPAGLYHWGDHIYSDNNWRLRQFGLDYWQNEVDPNYDPANYQARIDRMVEFMYRYENGDGATAPTAEEAWQIYRKYMDGSMGNLNQYDQRDQYEIKGSIYGALTKNLTFMFAGRYKKGVHIFPTMLPYQPEHNYQAKLNYYFSDNRKLTLNYIYGDYETSAYRQSGLNSQLMGEWGGRVMSELSNPTETRSGGYDLWGANWQKGVDHNKLHTLSLKWSETLSAATFYTVQFDYLSNRESILQDYTKYPDNYFTVQADSTLMTRFGGDATYGQKYAHGIDGNYEVYRYAMAWNAKTRADAYRLKADLTSQLTQHHQFKTGVLLQANDLDFKMFRVEMTGQLPVPHQTITANIWDGNPLEASFYVQDKIEYSGIVLNLGLRIDGFTANKKWPESPIFDPLGQSIYSGSNGQMPTNDAALWFMHYDPAEFEWAAISDSAVVGLQRAMQVDSVMSGLSNRNTVDSEWKWAVSPRIGVSFPITETSKLRFSYGHFYQKPEYVLIYGQNVRTNTADVWGYLTTEPNSGYWGNPGLSFSRAIQYELGYDQSILDMFRTNITLYYKDQDRLTQFQDKPASSKYTSIWTGGSQSEVQNPFITAQAEGVARSSGFRYFANDIFKDTRGLELNIEKLFTGRWSSAVTLDYGLSSGGKYGLTKFEQATDGNSRMRTNEEVEADWFSSYRLKANFSYVTPTELLYVLGDLTVGLYYEYYAGPEYTWYPSDYEGLQYPKNKRWPGHQRTDLVLTKKFNKMGCFTPTMSCKIMNLFNNMDKRLLGGTDLDRWEENNEVPTQDVYVGEGDKNYWYFYNPYSNPKRMIYVTLGLEF